jgi:hypothetical protein
MDKTVAVKMVSLPLPKAKITIDSNHQTFSVYFIDGTLNGIQESAPDLCCL